MRRRRFGGLAVALLLVVAGCGNSTAEECNEYLVDFASVVVPAGDILVERALEFRAYEAGEIELDQLSSALAQSAAEMEAVLTAIDALGEAPPELAGGVEKVVAGFNELQGAFELDPGLGLATDPELLDQYGVMTRKGVDLIEEGTAALGPCPEI
jgi:hypothetical protein